MAGLPRREDENRTRKGELSRELLTRRSAGVSSNSIAALTQKETTVRLNRIFLTLPLAVFTLAGQTRNLEPREEQKLLRVVAAILSQNSYTKKPLDDERSQQILEKYLDELDPNHFIFLQSDVDKLRQTYGTALDESLLQGNPDSPKVIFAHYLARLKKAVATVDRLVGENHDLSIEESISLDSKNEPWPKDEAAAEELWRKRIKSDFLSSKLVAEKSDAAAKRTQRQMRRALSSNEKLDNQEVLGRFLGAVSHAYDPHSDYLPPKEQKEFQGQMSAGIVGIGATLKMNDDQQVKIEGVVKGSPAEKSGELKAGDLILAIAQGKSDGKPGSPSFEDVAGSELDEVVSKIRGDKGTEVTLLIKPGDSADPTARKMVVLTRAEIQIDDQLPKAKIIEYTQDGVTHRLGVVNLPSFNRPSINGQDTSVAEMIGEFIVRLEAEQIEGLVLGLQSDGGGLVDEAQRLVGLFVKSGPVTQVRDSKGRIRSLKDPDGALQYDGPLVVRTNKLSASASEITAAALQDYERAIVVGDKTTFGKGTVQQVVDLENPMLGGLETGGLQKFTMQKFYRINGDTTQLKGVLADVALPSSLDAVEISEASMSFALPSDNIPPAEYDRTGKISEAVRKKLAAQSAKRVAANVEFQYLVEDSSRYAARKKIGTISLKESVRAKEVRLEKEREDQRKVERIARVRPTVQTFEIDYTALKAGTPLAELKAKAVDLDKQTGDQAAEEATELETLQVLRDLIDATAGK